MKYTEGLVVGDLVEKTKGRWPKQVHVSVTTRLCERKDHLVGLVVFIYVLFVHMTQSANRLIPFIRFFL